MSLLRNGREMTAAGDPFLSCACVSTRPRQRRAIMKESYQALPLPTTPHGAAIQHGHTGPFVPLPPHFFSRPQKSGATAGSDSQGLVHPGKRFFGLIEEAKHDRVAELGVSWLIHFQNLVECRHVDGMPQVELPSFIAGRLVLRRQQAKPRPWDRQGSGSGERRCNAELTLSSTDDMATTLTKRDQRLSSSSSQC